MLRAMHFATTLAVVCASYCNAQTAEPKPAETVPMTPVQPAGAVASEPPKRDKKPVYDEKADANVDIANALARANKNNTRVLIQWGANWCGWCILLHNTCRTDAAIAKKLQYEYEVVHVDIGRFDKHTDLAAKYNADLKNNGVPFLTVLDASGNVLANQETGSLETKDAPKGKEGHDTAKVLAFLTKHEATPLKAETVLANAQTLAREQGKSIFLHFGAPWCGWCHRLEAWMAKPEVASILAKDFIDLKIDTDRMTGGDALYKARCKKAGGIPWFEFTAADGTALITSDGPEGNTGFPASADEIAHFGTMLRKVRKNMTEAEIDTLLASLKAPSKKN